MNFRIFPVSLEMQPPVYQLIRNLLTNSRVILDSDIKPLSPRTFPSRKLSRAARVDIHLDIVNVKRVNVHFRRGSASRRTFDAQTVARTMEDAV